MGLTFGRFTVNDKNLKVFYPKTVQDISRESNCRSTPYTTSMSGRPTKVILTEGKTTQFQNPIKFKLTPLSVGLRYRLLKLRFIEPFVGAGLNFYSYKETISGETRPGKHQGQSDRLPFPGWFLFPCQAASSWEKFS